MNYKALKNDFSIRYDTKQTVKCCFCGTVLFLLGDITPGFALTTSLSAGTALLYAPTDNNLFGIQSTDSNILYSCSKDKLLQYHEDNFAKDTFHMLAYLTSDSPNVGANFLFSHNAPASFFHNNSGALCLLFSKHFLKSPKVITEKLPSAINNPQHYITLMSSMTAKKNHAELYDNCLYKTYPLPILGCKTVIITANLKRAYLSQRVNGAIEMLRSQLDKNIEFADISREMLFDIPAQHKQLLEFCINEKKRIYAYPQISSSHEFCDLINASSFELLRTIKSKDISLLADCVSSFPDLCAFRPTFDGRALYCIIPDGSVDNFITHTEAMYEKKAGLKPAFYICDTITH